VPPEQNGPLFPAVIDKEDCTATVSVKLAEGHPELVIVNE
jgi:hypothetical protein